jgi:hypothetical protein
MVSNMVRLSSQLGSPPRLLSRRLLQTAPSIRVRLGFAIPGHTMTATATTPEREPRQQGKTLIGAGLRSGLVQVGPVS